MKTDVVIIGGGIIGCAAAYYLAKNKIDVTVIEKNPAAGMEASGRNGGGVRQQGRKAALPLSIESVKLWATLSEELNADLEYDRIGNLKIALDEDTAENYEIEAAWEHENGLSETKILTGAECLELIPGVKQKIFAGKICPSDGIANPMLTSPAFSRASIKLGAKFLLNTNVSSLLRQGSQVTGVQTESMEINARYVINAAGPWASQFNMMAGCPIIIKPGISQLMITERLHKPFINIWVHINNIGYIRPTRSGNLVIGSSGTQNDLYSQHVNYYKAAIQSQYLTKLIPILKDISIIRVFSGITDYTPDKEPYIGAVAGAPGFYVAAGFHGQGFCPGPMVGKILAEMISGNEVKMDLEPFRPDRFSTGIQSGKPAKVQYPFKEMSGYWSQGTGIPESLICG
ncbi:MAG: FAD-binding oxidoreductase [Chloroflexota bacterium]